MEDLGGGLKTGTPKGVILGGPLAGIIPPQLLDTRLAFEELHSIHASVGHGGVVAFDEHTAISELVHHVFSFGAYEFCGKCTPCRLGSQRIEEMFRLVLERRANNSQEQSDWAEIISALRLTSLCGLGTGLAEFAETVCGTEELPHGFCRTRAQHCWRVPASVAERAWIPAQQELWRTRRFCRTVLPQIGRKRRALIAELDARCAWERGKTGS